MKVSIFSPIPSRTKNLIIFFFIEQYYVVEELELDEDTEMETNDEKIWSNSNTWSLVKIRLQRENAFSEGILTKNSLWNEISRELGNSRGILVSGEKCSKKFGNLKITYNNNKEKVKENDVNLPSWEFFDVFDAVYGNKEMKSKKRSQSALKEICENLQPIKKQKLEPSIHSEVPEMLTNGNTEENSDWWKEYFTKKLELEEKHHKDYIQMEKDRTKALEKLTQAILNKFN